MKKVRIIPLILLLAVSVLSIVSFWVNFSEELVDLYLCFLIGFFSRFFVDKLTDFVFDFIFPGNDITNLKEELEMSELEKILQGNPTYEKLKKLALFAEQKYGEDHPDVKDGDCIAVRDYLNTLFGIMIVARVEFPPVTIGEKVYCVCALDDDEPFINEYEVFGIQLLADSWYVCGEDQEFNKVGSEYCFLTREEAEGYLNSIKGDPNA